MMLFFSQPSEKVCGVEGQEFDSPNTVVMSHAVSAP